MKSKLQKLKGRKFYLTIVIISLVCFNSEIEHLKCFSANQFFPSVYCLFAYFAHFSTDCFKLNYRNVLDTCNFFLVWLHAKFDYTADNPQIKILCSEICFFFPPWMILYLRNGSPSMHQLNTYELYLCLKHFLVSFFAWMFIYY